MGKASLDRDFIREYIAERAEGASEAIPCHWIHGANEYSDIGCDEGTDFCRPCAAIKIAEIVGAHPEREVSLDGGWGSEHDTPPYCDTCGAKLQGSLTNYGVDQELEHFESYHPKHCESWAALQEAVDQLAKDEDNRWAVVEKIITTTVRTSLIDVLTAWELEVEVRDAAS